MINFIICEDEEILIAKYKTEIYNFMMNYDTEYKIHSYKGYTDSWKEYAQKELESFWDEYKRLDRPHLYKVDLSDSLYELKREMIESIREAKVQA